MEDDPKWEISVLVYPQAIKLEQFEEAALTTAASAFNAVQRGAPWTCLYNGQRRALVAERTGEVAPTDTTTNAGRSRQQLWGAEYRVGVQKEEP